MTTCCCCLPCNHCSNWTWVVEEILAFGTRLRSTHCREFNYLKLQTRPIVGSNLYFFSLQEKNDNFDIQRKGCCAVVFTYYLFYVLYNINDKIAI